MIQITPWLSIDESELHEEFVRASGPGGQNVNKVASAVQLRFDVQRSASLPDDVRARLLKQAANRINSDGFLIITAQGYRTQPENREAALTQLITLLKQAAIAPKRHVKTGPTRASKLRRLDKKRRHGQTKHARRLSHFNENDS